MSTVGDSQQLRSRNSCTPNRQMGKHNGKCYLSLNGKAVLTNATTWIKLEDITVKGMTGKGVGGDDGEIRESRMGSSQDVL